MDIAALPRIPEFSLELCKKNRIAEQQLNIKILALCIFSGVISSLLVVQDLYNHSYSKITGFSIAVTIALIVGRYKWNSTYLSEATMHIENKNPMGAIELIQKGQLGEEIRPIALKHGCSSVLVILNWIKNE